MIDKQREDAIYDDFVELLTRIGGAKYLLSGDMRTGKEWREGEIRSDIRKFWDKYPDDRETAYVPENFQDIESSMIVYRLFKEIGRKGSGKDDKLIRHALKIKKKKKKSWFKKALKTVTNPAVIAGVVATVATGGAAGAVVAGIAGVAGNKLKQAEKITTGAAAGAVSQSVAQIGKSEKLKLSSARENLPGAAKRFDSAVVLRAKEKNKLAFALWGL